MPTHGDAPSDSVRPSSSRTHFPQSRTTPPRTPGGLKDLGVTPLALQLGLTVEQTNGHWCSRCHGIWFGYTLEVQCPVCGNRSG